MKKIINITISLGLIASILTTGTFTNQVAADSSVSVCDRGNAITIENDYISRTLTKENNGILTSSIRNKRLNLETKPQKGSEDFVINLLTKANQQPDIPDKIENKPIFTYEATKLDATAWHATLTNQANEAFSDEHVATLFDDDPNTYVNDWEKSGHPFTLHMDLQEEQSIASMSIQKRPGYSDEAYGINGTMGGYEIYTSMDDDNWTLAASGAFTKEDYNLHQENDVFNVGDMVYVNFEPVQAKFVKVVQTSVAFGTAEEFTSAEVALYSDHIIKKQVVKAPVLELDRSNWKATLTNAADKAFLEEHVKTLFDGNTDTYVNDYKLSGEPFTLEIDLQTEKTIRSFSVDKRPGYTEAAYGTNGTMGKFELYVSNDKETWEPAGMGEFTKDAYNLHTEDHLFNVGDRVYANFLKPYTTRYVRLVQTSHAFGSVQEFTSSEINIYEDAYIGPNWNTEMSQEDEFTPILSSELLYNDYIVSDIDGGKKLTISYAPIEKNDVTYDIKQIFAIEGNDHFLRSFIEIKVDDTEKARIDYIDTDRFVLPPDAEGIWSHPDEEDVSSMWMGKHELMLGQPIYVNGLFMGSEFPATDTIITDNTTQVRYYSGKSFDQLRQDNQLTKDGKFVSWQNVIGAAEGVDTPVVQTSFFEYIEQIATPTEFRKQYNSWYDNMMNISDASIASSFLGAEAGLSKEGIEPLDSYVVDDGWNNYYDGVYTATPGSSQGTTPNQTGFWEFNAKFPNELYTSTALSNKLQSTFGLWLGPQGGYNYFPTFGKFIEASGTGYMQSDYWNNVCVGSDKYVKNLETLFIDYQNRFNIDYWKWDGFAVRPCTNATHDHMTGGYKNMYFTTDQWEKWTNLFENVRAARAKEGKGLFINATCYVNLSPWMLQWVNTVWVQDSGDTGEAGSGERHERKIYYRDNVYYNLYKQNQVQFPLKNIYNHDPIYGVSDGSNATTDVFREYMFANAVRGTAFWELYFSPSLFDEAKWKVTADVLDFAENNFDILKNAKMFGDVPTKGVYGYSSWLKEQGIISFTNPLDSEQSFTLTIDDTVGAVKTLKDASGIMIYPYEVGTLEQTLSYGDDLTVTLAPHETKILQFNKTDVTAPSVVSSMNTDNQHVRIKFSERIHDDGVYRLNGKEVQAQLLDDYRTIEITSDEAIPMGTTNIAIDNVTDAMGNAYNGETITFKTYNNGIIADLSEIDTFVVDPATGNDYVPLNGKAWNVSENGIEGTGSFAISFTINTKSASTTLLHQGDDIQVSIDADGYLHANIGSQEITTKEVVTTVVEKAHGIYNTEAYVPTTFEENVHGIINDGKNHSVVISREANGMMKMYMDGALVSSVYEANKKANIHNAAIVLGSTSLTGKIANFAVVNHEIDYKKAAELANNASGVQPIKTIDRSNWTATACSEMPGMSGDAMAMAAIDGNMSSWWHTNYVGADSHEGNHWIALDFHDTLSLDEIHYTGRGGSNGDVVKYNLYAMVDGEWTKVISEGSFDSNAVTNTIQLNETLHTDGIRFELLETIGGFGAAKEIEAFQKDVAIDGNDLAATYAEMLATFKATDKDAYTSQSYAMYKKAFDKFTMYYEAVKNGEQSTKFVAEKIIAEVQTAYAQLVEVQRPSSIARDILQAAIVKAEKANLEHVAPSIVMLFQARLAEAKHVYNDPMAKDEDVLSAWMQLANAMQYLDFIANKTDLATLIAECDEIVLTDYSQGVEEFKAALQHAKDVYADQMVLQDTIQNAYAALVTAKDGLLKENVDKALLQQLFTSIQEVVEDGSRYNQADAAWEIFLNAMEQADNLLNDKNASQLDVNKAFTNLANAYVDIRLLPDEALLRELQAFVTLVEQADMSQFSAKQVTFITNTKTSAVEMLNNPDAITQTKKEQMQKDMQEVLNILQMNQKTTPDITQPDAPVISQSPEDVQASKETNTKKNVNLGIAKTGDMTKFATMTTTCVASFAILLVLKRKNKKRS